MGSICFIDRNPKRWIVFDKGHRLRTTGEKLVTVRCGTFDDDPGGIIDIELYMRQSVLDKLIAGEYRISQNSSFHGWPIITDQIGTIVTPVKEGFCY